VSFFIFPNYFLYL